MTRRSRALGAVVLSLVATGHPSRSLAQSAFTGPRIVGRDPSAGAGGAVTRILALGRDAAVLTSTPLTRPHPAHASVGLVGPEIQGVRPAAAFTFWPRAGAGTSEDEPSACDWAAIDGRLLVQRITLEGGGEPWLLDPATGAWTSAGETIDGPLGGEPRLLTSTHPPTGGLSGATGGVPRVYFVACDHTLRPRVWRSDGTPGGLIAATPHGSAWALAPLAGDMLALGYELDGNGSRLWRLGAADGSVGWWPGGYPGGLLPTPWGAELAVSDASATTLYRTDGAAMVSLGAVPGRAELLGLAGRADSEADAARMLRVRTPGGGQELWSFTHGAGAVRLSGGFSTIEGFAAARDLGGRKRLVFAALSPGAAAPELWVSDGSAGAAGTHRLAASGVASFGQVHAWGADRGVVYFTGAEPATGRELWRTDGTAAGTHRLTDLRPGPDDSNPRVATVVNSRLYFAAADPQGVDQLWRLDLCPADFDNGGAVSVQDLFDYLVAYFGLDWRADVNANALVTVQDVFDFLTVYLGGCRR